MFLITNKNDKNRALDILEDAFISSRGMTWMLKTENKKDLMPSSFLTALMSICNVSMKDRMVYENSLYSQYELLHAIGHHGIENFSGDDLSVFPHNFSNLFNIVQ